MTTVVGTAISVAAAYMAMRFNNIMDMLQLVFSFVNAPLFATFLLGMFWKRTTGHGAFWGLVAGTGAAAMHYELTATAGGRRCCQDRGAAHLPVRHGAEFLGRDLGLDDVLPRDHCREPRDDAETRPGVEGLVFGSTPHSDDSAMAWYLRPAILGVVVLLCTAAFNVIFW